MAVWIVLSGTLPIGWNLNSSTGEITGTTVASGAYDVVFQVTVNDEIATAECIFSIWNSPNLQTLSLPAACVTHQYSVELKTNGGELPLIYLTTGTRYPNIFPPGLRLDPNTGFIEGMPTVGGTYLTDISVNDSEGCKHARQYSFVVYDYPLFLDTTLPKVCLNKPYSKFLLILDGKPPYGWFVAPTDTLPEGLSLNPNTGEISGVATVPGNYNFTINVIDQNRLNIYQGFSLFVDDSIGCFNGISYVIKERLISTLSEPVVVRDPFHQTHMNEYLPTPFSSENE